MQARNPLFSWWKWLPLFLREVELQYGRETAPVLPPFLINSLHKASPFPIPDTHHRVAAVIEIVLPF